MSRESYKAIERAKKIGAMSMEQQRAYLESEKRHEPEKGSADCAPRTCSASASELEELYQMISACRTYADCQCWGSVACKARELMRHAKMLLDKREAKPMPNIRS